MLLFIDFFHSFIYRFILSCMLIQQKCSEHIVCASTTGWCGDYSVNWGSVDTEGKAI